MGMGTGVGMRVRREWEWEPLGLRMGTLLTVSNSSASYLFKMFPHC